MARQQELFESQQQWLNEVNERLEALHSSALVSKSQARQVHLEHADELLGTVPPPGDMQRRAPSMAWASTDGGPWAARRFPKRCPGCPPRRATKWLRTGGRLCAQAGVEDPPSGRVRRAAGPVASAGVVWDDCLPRVVSGLDESAFPGGCCTLPSPGPGHLGSARRARAALRRSVRVRMPSIKARGGGGASLIPPATVRRE